MLVIASSDMNHYESDSITRVKDERAIARILALDPRGLYDTVRNEEISMCGYAATVAMLVAARELGAKEARLVRYATSGDVTGDRERWSATPGLSFARRRCLYGLLHRQRECHHGLHASIGSRDAYGCGTRGRSASAASTTASASTTSATTTASGNGDQHRKGDERERRPAPAALDAREVDQQQACAGE